MSVVARFLNVEPPSAADPALPLTMEPMRRRDLRVIMPIEEAAYPTSWSRKIFESEIEQMRDGTRYYLVAKYANAVVGYGGLWFVADPDGDQAHITNIAVAESHRRTGVATALMIALAEVARERGCVAWTLEVRASSTGAQNLYRRFGFAPVGVRQRYYDNTEDAVVMWCHDLATDAYARTLDAMRREDEPTQRPQGTERS